jgi:uncharacterized protein YdeI (YjbR/CyaY-like superfamily)
MKDPRVDDYIANAPGFAKPILKELRGRMHAAVPGVVETIRWGAPYFQYQEALLCGMAAFKAHCAFGFWHPLMRDGDTSLEGLGGWKIASIDHLPSAAAFTRLAKKARKLVDEGVKGPARPKRDPNRTLAVPGDLSAALARNAKARAAWQSFSYSKRKDYVNWIGDEKRDATRPQRVATTIEWVAEGRSRHWRYETA